MATEIRPIQTQEIGSLVKPGWRVKGVSDDSRIIAKDIKEADEWGRRLSIQNHGELVGLLRRREAASQPPNDQEKQEIRNWSVIYALALLEKAGDLDVVYSGEQWRPEMYQHVAENIGGFNFLGHVQSFDNKYYKIAEISKPPKFLHPIHLEEFRFVKKHTTRATKVPITDPYTLVEWSFNTFYEQEAAKNQKGAYDPQKVYFEARREALKWLVREIYRPEIRLLIKEGATEIQLDGPAWTTKPDEQEMDLAVEITNDLTRGFPSSVLFSFHNCFSDYARLAKAAAKFKDIKRLYLEFANRDSPNLGTDEKTRNGYGDLKYFEQEGYSGDYGVGVLHIHNWFGNSGSGARVQGFNILESPQLVRDRILRAVEIVGDASRISANPDCGLRTRTWEVDYEKLSALRRGAELARERLGLEEFAR